MSDLKLTQYNGFWDLSLTSSGDLETTGGLYEAVMICLFSNARADSTEIKESQNRYGWWADSILSDGIPIGSKLYQFKRRKLTNEVVELLRETAESSLKSLEDDGVSSRNVVKASRTGLNSVDLIIKIFKPDGIEGFNFSFAWDGIETRVTNYGY